MSTDFFVRNRINIFVVAGVLVYNDLFYGERFGLNILLFILLILGFLFVIYKDHLLSRRAGGSALLTLFTAAILVWHNSLLSCWMFFISSIITLGFVLEPQLRFTGNAALTAVLNFVKFPKELFNWNQDIKQAPAKKVRVSRILAVSLLPLAIVLVFFMIYRIANPMFADITDNFFDIVGRWLNKLYENISFLRLLFILSGIVIVSGILYQRSSGVLLKKESAKNDAIQRTRRRFRMPFMRMGFKNEFTSGIILLVLMNLMILVLNCIDIKYIWISFKIPEGVSLTEMVHEGTEWLIVSIVLSIMVMIYLFRANQNFYSRAYILKFLAYAWILQNIILTISLMLRNNQYIAWHALAYKRLGVYVFIFLTFAGLITMLIKIYSARSLFYLLRVNSWIAYIVLCGICTVNWDIFIARYNAESGKGAGVDTDFYLELSPKAYPYIYERLDKILAQVEDHKIGINNNLRYSTPAEFKKTLDTLSAYYLARHSEDNWRSYNRADAYALGYLKEKINR